MIIYPKYICKLDFINFMNHLYDCTNFIIIEVRHLKNTKMEKRCIFSSSHLSPNISILRHNKRKLNCLVFGV